MPHVGPRATILALLLILLFTVFPTNFAIAWRIVGFQDFRGAVEACRQDYKFPQVHVLPIGVGKAPVARCFNNGFTTIYPHSDQIGSCLIALKDEEERYQQNRLQQRAIKILRHKYSCRFLGAGAVLGQSRGVRETGTKVFFQGEEPTNFKTRDPGCEAIFEKLNSESDDYDHLISGR